MPCYLAGMLGSSIRRLWWRISDGVDYGFTYARLWFFDWARGPEPPPVVGETAGPKIILYRLPDGFALYAQYETGSPTEGEWTIHTNGGEVRRADGPPPNLTEPPKIVWLE
jgi:hypothetical protein